MRLAAWLLPLDCAMPRAQQRPPLGTWTTRIRELLEAAPEGMRAAEIAARIGYPLHLAKAVLGDMRDIEKSVESGSYVYRLAP